MTLINKLFYFIRILISQPLSILRFALSLLFGRKLIGYLEFIYHIKNNTQYSLSKTWFTNLIPDSLFVFNNTNHNLLFILIAVFTLTSMLGILGRLSLLILSFLGFYVLGVVEGIGVFDHHLSLPNQVVFALALIPGSMKLSIDYILLRYFTKRQEKLFIFPKSPKWGLNLILALLILTYLTAGISKLRYGHGINWLDGSTLGFYLKERTLTFKEGEMQLILGDYETKKEDKWKDDFGFIGHAYANYQTSKKMNAIADYIASRKFLLIMLSIGSVLFELFGFIVFFNSKFRNIYLVSAILFHLSIGGLMGISFRQYRLICFCLIDWNSVFGYINNKFKRFDTLKSKTTLTC